MFRIRALLLILIITLLATACSEEIDLTLQKDQKWEFETEVSINFSLLPELEFNVLRWLGVGVDIGDVLKVALEVGFDQVINYYQSQGMQASWKKPLNLFGDEDIYQISVAGQDWDRLARLTEFDPALFGQAQGMAAPIRLSIISVTDIGNDQVRFFWELPKIPKEVRYLSPLTFRLHGREIIACNGCIIDGGTATWRDPHGVIEAVLVPASPFPQWATIGLITLGTGLGAGLLIWLIKSLAGRRQSPYGSRYSNRGGRTGTHRTGTRYRSRRTRSRYRRR